MLYRGTADKRTAVGGNGLVLINLLLAELSAARVSFKSAELDQPRRELQPACQRIFLNPVQSRSPRQ